MGAFFNFGTGALLYVIVTVLGLTFLGGTAVKLLTNPIALLVIILIFFLLFRSK